jgi:NAD kinase
MVVNPDAEIRIEFDPAGEPVYLTGDGQKGVLLTRKKHVTIRRSEHTIKLVVTEGYNFFELLSRKLNWVR